ncbi:3-oxoacyl-ACP synthase [Flavobacteriaceae bacterium F89]|uniref:3-oxoacyl-ACP synthase n=1 Tax=Cerina litoralis TaxID=2874477 RepID=A0AAE3JNX6_9FLAO|nr:3-oxoacyl-ACP synthase [Cerina litoralis]MCG2460199.1 3-oxoacyl-ACP synthase [Cerina litoralis]
MKKPTYHIKSYCHIRENTVSLNGVELFVGNGPNFPVFIKSVYKKFKVDYPKFFKMDNLSKLAFMAAEVLLTKENLGSGVDNNIALVFANRASSLDTDRKHGASIEDDNSYYPSPAVFVYTLPNICLGEISIKHKLFSENSFFIFDGFNAEHLFHYSSSLLDLNKAEEVLCGWVDLDENNYEAFLYLVSKDVGTKYSVKAINSLY